MSLASTIFLCIFLLHHTCRSEPLAGWPEPVNPHEFLSVVSIARKHNHTAANPYGHVCGGALIHWKHVLTAASCFASNRPERDYVVYVGSIDLALSTGFDIESLTTYDMWLRRTTVSLPRLFDENDIAIIRLSTRVSKPARPAKMVSIAPMELVGRGAITAGWGMTFTDNNHFPRRLLKANLRVMNNSQCFEKVRIASNGQPYSHQENFFCTNGVYFFAVLDEGDKGSPVVVKAANGQYQIVGVNQKAVPRIDDVRKIPDQQNKHVSIHYYFDFIRIVSHVLPLLN